MVGEIPDADAVGGLAVFKNRLWASSLYKPASLYSLDEKGTWKQEPLPEADRRVESMGYMRVSCTRPVMTTRTFTGTTAIRGPIWVGGREHADVWIRKLSRSSVCQHLAQWTGLSSR